MIAIFSNMDANISYSNFFLLLRSLVLTIVLVYRSWRNTIFHSLFVLILNGYSVFRALSESQPTLTLSFILQNVFHHCHKYVLCFGVLGSGDSFFHTRSICPIPFLACMDIDIDTLRIQHSFQVFQWFQ